jgi:GTPase
MTLYGLISGAPSCIFLMVGANATGLIEWWKSTLAISFALSVSISMCITNIDMTTANVSVETTKDVVQVVKSPRYQYVHLTNMKSI